MDVKELLTSQKSQDFIAYMRKVWDINFYSTAYSNLLGFTIQGDKIQFKNYYELREMPSDALLAEFLPEIESFKMVSQFWDKTVKFSLVLAQKIDEQKETRYFHVKFGGLTRYVIRPLPAFTRLLEERMPNGGLSYEYVDGQLVKKNNYIYIENKDDMAKVLALAKIQADPQLMEHLECYYSTLGDFKVNLIYEKPPATLPTFDIDEQTQKTYNKVVEFLSAHNKPIWYVGFTKSKKLSVYFTCTHDKDFIQNL